MHEGITRKKADDYFKYLTPLPKQGKTKAEISDRIAVAINRFFYMLTHKGVGIDDEKIFHQINRGELADVKNPVDPRLTQLERLYQAAGKRVHGIAFILAENQIKQTHYSPEDIESYHLSKQERKSLALLVLENNQADFQQNFRKYNLSENEAEQLLQRKWNKDSVLKSAEVKPAGDAAPKKSTLGAFEKALNVIFRTWGLEWEVIQNRMDLTPFSPNEIKILELIAKRSTMQSSPSEWKPSNTPVKEELESLQAKSHAIDEEKQELLRYFLIKEDIEYADKENAFNYARDLEKEWNLSQEHVQRILEHLHTTWPVEFVMQRGFLEEDLHVKFDD